MSYAEEIDEFIAAHPERCFAEPTERELAIIKGVISRRRALPWQRLDPRTIIGERGNDYLFILYEKPLELHVDRRLEPIILKESSQRIERLYRYVSRVISREPALYTK